MDLIYTNKAREDMGVLQDFDLDLAFGSDENNFECTIPAEKHCCESGSLLYLEGTEYGGMVDGIERDTEAKEVKYKGRTWHGILGSKVIEPLKDGEAREPVVPSRVPDGYTELEYIESTGTQYIDTCVYATQNTRLVCDADLLSLDSPDGVPGLFGYYVSGTNQFAVFYSTKWQAWFGSSSVSIVGSYSGRKVVSLDSSEFKVGESSVDVNSKGFTSTLPIHLFGFCQNNKHMYAADMKLYSCQIYDNGTLVRDFVPCKDASGVVGLYDLANGAFYQNAGSGSFTAGGDIEQPEEPVVDETTLTVYGEDAEGNSLVGKFLVISGDANECIQFILERIGLADMFDAKAEASGVNIEAYQFDRFTDAYSGLMKMLASAGLKLKTEVRAGKAVSFGEELMDYTTDEEFDSDLVDFVATKTFRDVNHLVCLGSGELENRMVIHLYVDTDGNISQEQTRTGLDDYVAVFDYPNAESEEDLIQNGTEELLKLMEPDKLTMDFDDTTDNYDVGDIVGAYDNITGISVAAVITKKIVTIKNGQITISYKVGE
jgi:hypothetical protein